MKEQKQSALRVWLDTSVIEPKVKVIPFKAFMDNTWRPAPIKASEVLLLVGVVSLQVMLVGLVKEGVESGFLPS